MKREIIQGKIQGNERGYGFLIPDDKAEDYFIPHGDLYGAQHGDTVLCQTTSNSGFRTTARVLKIIERGITELVGTYKSMRTGGLVTPDEKKYYSNVFIPHGKGTKAKTGDKVLVKILSYPKRLSPEGIITKVLGRQNEKKAELKSILFNYRLPEKFPENVVSYAKNLPEVTKNQLEGRLDFRKDVCFTIDGETSRDFDDAVSIKKDGENFVLGVHIADVSHYVKQGDVIDKEAFNRATSVYFPESVIPMLPERLSNDLCSLMEGVERLTLSCVMTVNVKGDVVDYQISPSVIKSKRRLTYTKVEKILNGDKDLIKEYIDVYDSLLLMDKLREILHQKRIERGTVDLDVKESVITVLDNGKIDVLPSSSNKAHQLIEEFMILANVTVAEYAYFLELPFLYRVHGEPDTERLQNFYSFLDGLGIKIRHKKDKVYPKDFQNVLKEVEGLPYGTTVNRVMLRSMQKAKYSENNAGHFGLALKNYCHFTSPIRRYPDLVVHRILKDFLFGLDVKEKYDEFVKKASVQSSEQEKNAMDAERAVDDYYKMLYISDYVGESFEAVISGVTSFGVFAELNNGVEGLIRIENLPDGSYIFDANKYTLSNGKTSFRLGNPVKITVAGVDMTSHRAEFLLND